MSAAAEAALPYHEPDIITIVILASFVLLLNAINHVIDVLLYCGLLAQLFLGIAYGTPGGNILGREAEEFIVKIGYIGLLLLVYEGGLMTSFRSLKANLLLSSGVALTGICLPIGLSYVLMRLNNASPMQAFATGAALCSTSLGTTFAVMSSSGLVKTRMGVVLTSAAMMDDVVGLVMVQVILNLGASTSSFGSTTVIRPVFVSIAFAVIIPLVAALVARPLTRWINERREKMSSAKLNRTLSSKYTSLVIHTLILLALILGSSYAGTSNLFAAYLAGAAISWWDAEAPHARRSSNPRADGTHSSGRSSTRSQTSVRRRVSTNSSFHEEVRRPPQRDGNTIEDAPVESVDRWTGVKIFEEFYAQPLRRLLAPFFFASIGFSVPITRMFSGTVVWKGLIYTILMLIGKLACGLWLVRIPGLSSKLKAAAQSQSGEQTVQTTSPNNASARHSSARTTSAEVTEDDARSNHSNISRRRVAPNSTSLHDSPSPSKPLSLYPGCIVGCAMVARGEIGFLILALAESNGIFGEANSEIFLVITWAIILCTILGPISVGILVRRVKRLQEEKARGRAGGGKDVLGAWGVS